MDRLKHWGLPFLTAVGAFLIIQAIFFGTKEPTRGDLESYLKKGNIPVFSDSVEGYQQIFYRFNNVKVYISSNQQNHINPVSSGKYVSWAEIINGTNQLFLYDLLEKTKIQLSFSGTNFNQSMDGDRVVWERVVNEKTQIYYFDGTSSKQISYEHDSQRPRIKGGQIVFAQRLDNKKWRNMLYTIDSNKLTVISEVEGGSNAHPHFTGDDIKTKIYE